MFARRERAGGTEYGQDKVSAPCGVGVSRYPVITGHGGRGRGNARFKRGEIGSIAFSKFLFAVVAPSRVSSRSNYTFRDSGRYVGTHTADQLGGDQIVNT